MAWWCSAAVTAVLALCLVQSCAGVCKLKQNEGVLPKRFPEILRRYDMGYKLFAEINDKETASTMYLTEYYLPRKGEGFVKLVIDGEVTNVYYRRDTEEIFLYGGSRCATLHLDNPPKELAQLVLRYTIGFRNFTLFGASSLFVGPTVRKDYQTAYQGASGDVRGIRSIMWQACELNLDEPMELYFLDSIWDYGYGTGPVVPLRIVQGNETTDIMTMQPYPVDVDQVFKFPTGYGCTRLYNTSIKPPDFSSASIELHSELTHMNPNVSGLYFYTSHLDIIHDMKNKLFSYIIEPWHSPAPSFKPPTPAHRQIYDAKSGFLYLNRRFGAFEICQVSTKDNYTLTIMLPDNNTINVMDVIFLSYDSLQQAEYLGIQYVRGIPTHAFELSAKLLPRGSSPVSGVIVTYYYMTSYNRGSYLLTQRNLPVKVTIRTFVDFDDQRKPHYTLSANIHDISTSMDETNERMSVRQCFEQSEHTWLQVGFPVTEKLDDILGEGHQVKQRFLDEFLKITRISPLRLPIVSVDFTSNMVYVNALLLQRPLIGADFTEKKNFRLKSEQWNVPVITFGDCLKMCSGNNSGCSAVSYCGATCYATTMPSEDLDSHLVKAENCSSYIKKPASVRTNLPLSEQVVYTLREAVERSEFKVVVDDEYGDRLAILIAETLEDSPRAFPNGKTDVETAYRYHRQGTALPGFEVTQIGLKITPGSESSSHMGNFPLEDCADICRDREDCVSFSSCLVSSECIITTKKFTSKAGLSRENKCSVFAKIPTTHFRRFDGFSLSVAPIKEVVATTSQDCAALCEAEKGFDCKSFDFCLWTKEKKPSCRMHNTHLREIDNPSKLKDTNEAKCAHYARDYLYDYKKQPRKRFRGNPRTVIKKITVDDCASQCWQATFSCNDFDFCVGLQDYGIGTCTLYESSIIPLQTVYSPFCKSYSYQENPDVLVAKSNTPAALHSNATAGGLAFFMVLLGTALGAVALFAYGYYQARKANRV